jgi:type II secretory pathway component GspD/PulD (secretin)
MFMPVSRLSADATLPQPDVEPVISMDFQDANLKDVLKVFSIQSGMNFLASEGLQDRKVTLYMDKVPLSDAMNKLFKANNLTYDMDKQARIFVVKDWGKPSVETVTKVFYLKNATVSTASIKEEMSNNLTGDVSMFDAGTTTTTTTTSTSTSGSSAGTGKWKVEDESGITYAIKKILSSNGSLIEDYRTNSLIVTDVPSRMEVITQVVAALDVSIPQVLLEVEMLDVSKNVVDQLGVQWPTTLASLTVSGSKELAWPFGKSGTSGQGRTLTPAADQFGGGWDFAPWNAAHFGPSIFTVIGSTLTFDFLTTQTDTKILARPRVMTLNNETAEIKIATNEAIGVTDTTTSTGGTGITTAAAERAQVGVILRVTPQINLEAGEITLFVYPKVANASAGTPFIVADEDYQYRDPEERSTKQVVRLKDGETIVLGGLIRNETQTVVSKVPILGDIPIIGAAFRHKSQTPGRERELLVFITPHIIREAKPSDIAQAPAAPKPMRAAKAVIPVREQGEAAVVNRQASINKYITNYEK